MTYHRFEIERIAKKGFEMALKRGKKLCCVDKANVLEASRLWRETVQRMEKESCLAYFLFQMVTMVLNF